MFADIVICFILFSVCGWVCESIFCSILERKIVNRGFLSGPVCPVYGFGGLLVVFLLAPMRDHFLLLFLAGMLSTTALEYLTSWLLEVLFHTRWWDYSENRFNIGGRVCLSFSLIFGMLSVVAVHLLYPPFTALLDWIPLRAKPFLALGLLLLFVTDTTFTTLSILELNGRLEELESFTSRWLLRHQGARSAKPTTRELLEALTLEIGDKPLDRLTHRLEQFLARPQLRHKRILQAFPNMKSLRHPEQLEKFREAIDERRKKMKK